MFDPSLAAVYEPQHRLFGRLIRLCFSFAGCYWILIYGMQWRSMVDHDQLRELRSGQTLIYFILLSLWGIEYLREARRLKLLIRRSEELGVPVSNVSVSNISHGTGSFAVLHPIAPSTASHWTFPVLNAVGLAVALYLIAQRYIAALTAAQ
ncbi:MAG: hypothetical protein FGM32_00715 [Candidatus Kapabacteria bacterium]|nr:hypothetical protein [Candidatus Kapabacteria bacterium]